MKVSAFNSVQAFKAAKVESPSPLVSGDWQFVKDPAKAAVTNEPKKESHWLRNTLLWVVGIAAATAALVGIRNTKAVSEVMNAGGFKAQKGIGKKFLYGVGKLGDAAKWLKAKTWDKVTGLFKKHKAVQSETPTAPAAPKAPEAPAAPAAPKAPEAPAVDAADVPKGGA